MIITTLKSTHIQKKKNIPSICFYLAIYLHLHLNLRRGLQMCSFCLPYWECNKETACLCKLRIAMARLYNNIKIHLHQGRIFREPDKLRIFINYGLKMPQYECLSNFSRITYCSSFLSLRTWFCFVSYLRILLRGRRIRTLIIPFRGFPLTHNFSGWTSVRSKTLPGFSLRGGRRPK